MHRLLLMIALWTTPVLAQDWTFLELWQPATLRDCPPGTRITISTSPSIAGPWRCFCYHRRSK